MTYFRGFAALAVACTIMAIAFGSEVQASMGAVFCVGATIHGRLDAWSRAVEAWAREREP